MGHLRNERRYINLSKNLSSLKCFLCLNVQFYIVERVNKTIFHKIQIYSTLRIKIEYFRL